MRSRAGSGQQLKVEHTAEIKKFTYGYIFLELTTAAVLIIDKCNKRETVSSICQTPKRFGTKNCMNVTYSVTLSAVIS